MLLLNIRNHQRSMAGNRQFVDPLTNLPVRINFGRPNFERLFENVLDENKNNQFVYACAPAKMCT